MFPIPNHRRLNWIAAVMLSSLVFCSTVTATAHDRLALVIGNSDYPAPHVVPLPSCVKDAETIQEFLRSVGFSDDAIDVRTNATKDQMLAAFDESLAAARNAHIARGRPLDQFVFFYSGHGVTVADGSGDDLKDEGKDDLTDEAFLALPSAKHPPETTDDLLIRDDVFFAFLREIARETNQLVVLLDACHGGGLFRSIDPKNTQFPSKWVSEKSLGRYLDSIGAEVDGLNADVRARNIVVDQSKAPRELAGIECDYLFAAAASDYQAAASGDPLSQFTGGLHEALTFRRKQVLKKAGVDVLSIKVLRDYLSQRLASWNQQPVLYTKGKITDETAFLGSLFDDRNEQTTPEAGFKELLTWRLLIGSEANEVVSPDDSLPAGQGFSLLIQPIEDRYLYVLLMDPEAGPQLILPESRARRSEDDHLLKAGRFTSAPRRSFRSIRFIDVSSRFGDGTFRFTGPPATERLRLILSRESLNRDTLDQLKPQVTRKASSPKEVSEYMNRVQGDASDLYVLEQENHGRQVCSKDPVDIIVMEIGLKHL